MALQPYKFHKIWDTPALNKLNQQKIANSQDYQISGLVYRFHCLIPGSIKPDLYFIAVSLLNPPTYGHIVTIKVKLLHKKPHILQEVKAQFTPNSKTFIIEEGITIPDMTRVWNKGKVGIDFTIEYTKLDLTPPKPVPVNYRELTGHVGLVNRASTCYMNSVLEMLFYIPAFRKLIFSIPNSVGIPLELQRLFTLLQLSPTSPTTTDLIHSFGWTAEDSFIQHDIQEFIRVLIDNLEEKLKPTELSGQLGSLLSGETAVQIKCINSDFKKETPEIFYDITLTVKGKKDVYASLQEICEDELFTGDNQYEVETGRKEDAIRSTRFKKLPPVLMFHLSRFEFSINSPTGMEKVTDEYDYPTTLDLGPYTDSRESAVYDLLAVLVHIGGSWGGHYIAYCKSGNEWFKFNDERVEKVPEDDAITGNFGGKKSEKHAYYLCYIKRSESSWVMNEKIEIPKFLRDYYEEKREDLDPSCIAIRFTNDENKRLLVKKTSLVSEISQKELWKVDDENFPVELLNPRKSVGEYFTKSAVLYESDFDTKQIVNPKIFDIDFFSRTNTRIKHMGLMPFNSAKSVKHLSQTVGQILKLPEKCNLSCFDDQGNQIRDDARLSDLKRHKLIFQSDDIKYDISFEEKDEEEGILKVRNLIPEIVLDTVPRFVNHIKRCVHVIVEGLDQSLTIEIPDIMPLKILIMCIRKSLNLPDEDSVLIYNKDGMIINSKGSQKLKEALAVKEQFSQFMKIKTQAKIVKGIKQSDADNYIMISFHVHNEMFDFVSEYKNELPQTLKIKDLLEDVSQKTFGNKSPMRIIEITKSRITNIFNENLQISNLIGKSIRAEIVPNDQIDARLLPISFSMNISNPLYYTFLDPFLLSVNDGEEFELTKSRILSMITTHIKEFNFVLLVGSRYIQLDDHHIIADLIKLSKNCELFMVLTHNELNKFLERNENQAVKILN